MSLVNAIKISITKDDNVIIEHLSEASCNALLCEFFNEYREPILALTSKLGQRDMDKFSPSFDHHSVSVSEGYQSYQAKICLPSRAVKFWQKVEFVAAQQLDKEFAAGELNTSNIKRLIAILRNITEITSFIHLAHRQQANIEITFTDG
ncbi:hypothetical protein [Motilimonas sp. KMU-193]|uniref:hypothetical protein n=1 Tax=Motilimonas sp. KMU-193 TaxID=3388668 RepID=UPI00396B1CD6